MVQSNTSGFYPNTPASNLLDGLREATLMLLEVGLEGAVARHWPHVAAVRAAVGAWSREVCCRNAEEYSRTLTVVMVRAGYGADGLRKGVLGTYDISLRTGLGLSRSRMFCIWPVAWQLQ